MHLPGLLVTIDILNLPMSVLTIESRLTEVTAAIVGNSSGLSWYLVKELLDQDISVDLFHSKHLNSTHPLGNLLYKHPRFNQVLSDSPPENLSTYRYLFLVSSLKLKSFNTVKEVLEKNIGYSGKVTLVITEQPLTAKQQKNWQKITRFISEFLDNSGVNLRVVVLHDLYGPGIICSKQSLLSQFFNQFGQSPIKLHYHDQTIVYPLYWHDAVTGIIRSTLISQTKGKLLELGGAPLSLLNIAYRYRNLFPTKPPSIVAENTLNITDTSQTQARVNLSWISLRYQPVVDFTQGLLETYTWLHSHQPHSQEIPDTPTPLPQPDRPNFSTVVLPVEPPLVKQPKPVPIKNTLNLINQSQPSSESVIKTFSLPHSKTTSLPVTKPHKKTDFWFKKRPFSLPKPRKKLALAGVFILVIFLWLSIPIASLLFRAVLIKTHLATAKKALQTQNFSTAAQELVMVYDHSDKLYQGLLDYQPLLSLLLTDAQLSYVMTLAQIMVHSASAGSQLEELIIQAGSFARVITNQSSINLDESIYQTQASLNETYHQLSLVEAEIAANPDLMDQDFLGTGDFIKTTQDNISLVRQYLAQAHQLLGSAPELLGFAGKRTYLVLLQNNMELRPTGGFIGSFALITFEQGQLLDLQVEDVYTADGQLRGYVEPPAPIKKYLGEATWFLRDSNWDSHFPSSAETATWFLEKEIGVKVDGVIGVNLEVVKALLETTGPIELVDYKETISAQNLYERTQYQSEINFFPGSTQKKDYLGALTRTIYQRLSQADEQLLFATARSLMNSANNKQLLVYLNQPTAQLVMEDLGWSGSVIKPDCELVIQTDCIIDYLGVREANLGVNKANYFVKRSIKDTVLIGGQAVVHNLEINLENTSSSNVWPGGVYRNYMRVYVPKESTLKQIRINNKILTPSEVTITQEHGKTVWGFLVSVEPQSKVVIGAEYSLPQGLGSQSLAGYHYYLQKQPGTGSDPYQLQITYGSDLQVARTSSAVIKEPGAITVNTSIDTDKSYTIEFVR